MKCTLLWRGSPAKIIGVSDREMRRWYQRYQEFGYNGLYDCCLGLRL